MITRLKIKQLEGRLAQKQKGKGFVVWHNISEDGRLLDEKGFVMTNEEVRLIQRADSEVYATGGTIWFERSPNEPKLKPDSTIAQYVK